MAALLDIAWFLIPVVGLLVAFAAAMIGVFLGVMRLIERLERDGSPRCRRAGRRA